MSSIDANTTIVCIPVAFHPTEPSGARYNIAKCDTCTNDIWLGEKSATLVAQGIPKLCVECAVKSGVLTQNSKLNRLDQIGEWKGQA